ncbi:MAG: 4-oxalocrotonate tautomerase [Proteobacteria bacterium]|nr:4-oxalocrotonate tautomerase [Pseudomonadota bacterium]
MPLALTYTDGVLPTGAEAEIGRKITDTFLKWHGLTGNKVMTENVTMHIQALPQAGSLAGGKPVVGAWLECKTPSFAFADREVQEGFFRDATDIIEAAAGGKLPRNQIFSNVVHTVDGTWNMDGRALTNEEIGAALSRG